MTTGLGLGWHDMIQSQREDKQVFLQREVLLITVATFFCYWHRGEVNTRWLAGSYRW